MEQQIKQRVIGAGVLGLVGAVFIPMVLSGPPASREAESRARVALNPPRSEGEFSSRVVPLAPPVPEHQDSGHRDSGHQGSGRRESAPKRPGIIVQGSADARAAVRRSAIRARAAPAHGWAIQLGSFTNGRNALALRDRLKAEGYPAFVESARQRDRKVIRVLIGPETRREKANASLEALHRATKLQGFVVRYPDG